jgi:hypothetical protein
MKGRLLLVEQAENNLGRRQASGNELLSAHRGEKVNIAYQEDPLGGFRAALPGLANL